MSEQEPSPSPSERPDNIPSIDKWRNALKDMPEWDTLSDEYHVDILRCLRNTAYPKEPSGHATWKHVKAMLKEGRQPGWVQLITATFIWRVKRQKGIGQFTAAMPDSFVNEAALQAPPINISDWPTKDTAAAPVPRGAVKAEPAAEDPRPIEQRAPESVAPPITPAAQADPTISETVNKKRGRPVEEDDPMTRPSKQTKASDHSPQDVDDQLRNELSELKKKYAETAKELADLRAETKGIAEQMTEMGKQLLATNKRLRETVTEMRAKSRSNRQCVRRIVSSQVRSVRALQRAVE